MSTNIDDLLADATEAEATPKTKKKAAKPAAPAAKGKGKPAAAPAAKGKPAAAAAPAAKGKGKPAAAAKADPSLNGEVATAILKLRKRMSYADAAEATGMNIRSLRRCARGLRDQGSIELEKEGTVVFIKPVKTAKAATASI